MSAGERVAAAALACVGARFRLHGREPERGLDCVGVAAVATGIVLPRGYALRTALLPAIPDGVRSCDGERVGDVLVWRVSAAQLHLGVRTAAGFVHADAGLRRVVERALPAPWPLLAAYRKEE